MIDNRNISQDDRVFLFVSLVADIAILELASRLNQLEAEIYYLIGEQVRAIIASKSIEEQKEKIEQLKEVYGGKI